MGEATGSRICSCSSAIPGKPGCPSSKALQLPTAWLRTNPHLPLPGLSCWAWQEAARVQDGQGTPGILLPPRPVPRADPGISYSTAEGGGGQVEGRRNCLPLLPEAAGPAGPALPGRSGLLPLLPSAPSLPLQSAQGSPSPRRGCSFPCRGGPGGAASPVPEREAAGAAGAA